MKLNELVNEILLNAAFKKETKPYRNVYFIKVLNPGDGKSLFVSFRWKSSKNEVFICTVDINLEDVSQNTRLSIALLKTKERQSTTFFHKRSSYVNKSIIDILKQIAVPTLTEKLNKVESYYGN